MLSWVCRMSTRECESRRMGSTPIGQPNSVGRRQEAEGRKENDGRVAEDLGARLQSGSTQVRLLPRPPKIEDASDGKAVEPPLCLSGLSRCDSGRKRQKR